MQYSRLTFAARQLLAVALVAILTSLTWAQQPEQQSTQQSADAPTAQAQPNTTVPVETPQPRRFQLQDYTRPKGYFPNPVGPYTPRSVPPPDLSNTPRI